VKKPLKGSIATAPRNGTDWLPLVPGVPEVIADPRVRNELLLQEWEGASPSSVPFPDRPSVLFSKRCADSPEGRGFTAALVTLSAEAWLEAMDRAWKHVA
jgi:hypothetical protein